MVVRLHPFMRELKDLFFPQGVPVINATDLPDIQELLVASDAVVTDYSSCIYDFLLTGRPGFIYAPDKHFYASGRGLCYPLEETPFPLAADNSELEKNIEFFDEAAYKTRVKTFLQGKGSIDDGHASERVVNLIKSIIENETT